MAPLMLRHSLHTLVDVCPNATACFVFWHKTHWRATAATAPLPEPGAAPAEEAGRAEDEPGSAEDEPSPTAEDEPAPTAEDEPAPTAVDVSGLSTAGKPTGLGMPPGVIGALPEEGGGPPGVPGAKKPSPTPDATSEFIIGMSAGLAAH